jgi:hypothetical protein
MKKWIWMVMLLAGAAACRGGWIFDGVPSDWEGTAPELQPDEYTYPVLILELGGQWTDFELKASTNNFATLAYYVMSSATNAWTTDPDVAIYFTDDYSADRRKWRRAAVGTPIGDQLVDPVNGVVGYVAVCPSAAGGAGTQWMSIRNPALVWSYARYDGVGLEMNATGTKSRWHLATPAGWRREQVAP